MSINILMPALSPTMTEGKLAKWHVKVGDAILIPPGAWHQITATESLKFLCCCAPPYSHEDTYFE